MRREVYLVNVDANAFGPSGVAMSSFSCCSDTLNVRDEARAVVLLRRFQRFDTEIFAQR